jgi:hypothetical protein
MRAGGILFWVCCCLIVFVLLSLLCDCWPVVDRRLLPFLASPRKGSKRRRRKVAALRVPACAGQKMGKVRNSLPLQGAYPLASGYRYAGVVHAPRNPCYTSNTNLSNPFSAMHKRQRHMRKAKVNTSVVRLPSLRARNAQAHRATANCCF